MSEFASRWITLFIEDFHEAKEELGELDRIAGDGDFAVNLASALRLTERGLAELADDAGAADTFAAVSTAFLNTGGTSGPLLGMWFRELARAHRDEPEPVSALTAGISAGTATVQRLGGARPGDKTMVDAMVPAASALREASESGLDLPTALAKAATAAHEGADSTRHAAASMGRASYVGEAAAGVTDPGAAAIALFFRSGKAAADG